MKKGDLLLFVGFILIIAGMIALTFYQYTYNVNECTSDPLRYAVEEIRYNYDAEFVDGTMRVRNEDGIVKTWEFGDESNLSDILFKLE